jgi:hypothetical protein
MQACVQRESAHHAEQDPTHPARTSTGGTARAAYGRTGGTRCVRALCGWSHWQGRSISRVLCGGVVQRACTSPPAASCSSGIERCATTAQLSGSLGETGVVCCTSPRRWPSPSPLKGSEPLSSSSSTGGAREDCAAPRPPSDTSLACTTVHRTPPTDGARRRRRRR